MSVYVFLCMIVHYKSQSFPAPPIYSFMRRNSGQISFYDQCKESWIDKTGSSFFCLIVEEREFRVIL